VNVSVYVPGRNSTILYSPLSSVTTVRVFSISAGWTLPPCPSQSGHQHNGRRRNENLDSRT
jgi:hypothetical protein